MGSLSTLMTLFFEQLVPKVCASRSSTISPMLLINDGSSIEANRK
jgi:hypothetical protein